MLDYIPYILCELSHDVFTRGEVIDILLAFFSIAPTNYLKLYNTYIVLLTN